MNIIYADTHFLLNLVIDYFLCLVSARVCGIELRRLRYLGAAVIGAAYSVVIFLPGCDFLSLPAGMLGCGIVMGLAAFGGEERFWRCTLVFLAVSAAFGGAVWCVSLAAGGWYTPVSARVLLLSFSFCYGIMSLVFRGRAKLADRARAKVCVRFLGRSCCFTALVDSGNTLTDPITGKRVIVASPHALRELFQGSADILYLKDSVAMMEAAARDPCLAGRMRLIPYSSLGGSGMLPVFCPESLDVDGRADPGLLVAISPAVGKDGYEAVI